MDDNVSIKSSDSVTTSGEYEMVPEASIDMSSTSPQSKDVQPITDVGATGITGPGSGSLQICDPSNPGKEKMIILSPQLNIANNGNIKDLEKNMTEVIHELEVVKLDENYQNLHSKEMKESTTVMIKNHQPAGSSSGVGGGGMVKRQPPNTLGLKSKTLPAKINTDQMSTPLSTFLSPISDVNKVGQSVFYDCTDFSSTAEKQDDMKPERSDTDEEMSDIDQDCTVFAGVTYLGAATINAPKSETEIHRNMAELNAISDMVGLKISVSIPSCSEGHVVLYDATTNGVVAHYEVQRILFYARGAINTADQACFAFTWSHGDSQESAIFQCHVFRCQIPEAVTQVSACFAKAFNRIPQSLTGSVTSSAVDNNSVMITSITSDLTGNPITSAEYEFIVSLEIREKVAKNSYQAVPRDRSCFRLRNNVDKEVCITVRQTPSDKLPPLTIERCFGVLLSPGKLVRQADMQLLDMVSMGYVSKPELSVPLPSAPYQIQAEGKASDKAFGQLAPDSKYITVAVDLVIKGIQEPVRFVIETPVQILTGNEMRFMDHFINKRSMTQRFYLQLKDNGEGTWEVNSIDPSEEIIDSNTQSSSSSIIKLGINNLSKMVRSASVVSLGDDDSPTLDSSDGDEPLLSGTGEVSKECPQESLDEWGPILQEWTGDKRPKYLTHLVRAGVPEALRGKVWQRLANVENKVDMTERYRVLLTMDTSSEPIILRDIHRTFPAHKFFREIGGSGQDALYKVSKAYAVYDSEVGYCQGLSFIAASLLLHMPEEEAFSVLVALMYDYGLRDLYKHGFESLYIRLYQLNRLMKDQLPKLYEHFQQTGIETHMFASQWFLTLFTARFPLYFVFHILDTYLLDGMPILFQVALTLLSTCEADLRQLDFEGILKYFRVTLPKKCRSTAQARKLMKSACERKVKKLKQYEEEFITAKRIEEREENETREIDQRLEAERRKMQSEMTKMQEKLDQVIEQSATSEKKSATIILDYKQIIQRHEQQITKLNEMLEDITKVVNNCTTCSASITPSSPLHNTFGNLSADGKRIGDAPLGPLDPLNVAHQRIRELELELAQAKLAQVEAECRAQDLNHQLSTTLNEIQSNRSSWQPWLSKTLNSIQEKVVNKRDSATFQSYVGDSHANSGNTQQQIKFRENSPNTKRKLATTQSNRNSFQRNSVDLTKTTTNTKTPSGEPVLKDSLSCNSLK